MPWTSLSKQPFGSCFGAPPCCSIASSPRLCPGPPPSPCSWGAECSLQLLQYLPAGEFQSQRHRFLDEGGMGGTGPLMLWPPMQQHGDKQGGVGTPIPTATGAQGKRQEALGTQSKAHEHPLVDLSPSGPAVASCIPSTLPTGPSAQPSPMWEHGPGKSPSCRTIPTSAAVFRPRANPSGIRCWDHHQVPAQRLRHPSCSIIPSCLRTALPLHPHPRASP